MNQQAAISTMVRTGKLNVPRHLRGTTALEHGTKLEVLQDNPGGDPQRVLVRIKGKEIPLEKRYVTLDS